MGRIRPAAMSFIACWKCHSEPYQGFWNIKVYSLIHRSRESYKKPHKLFISEKRLPLQIKRQILKSFSLSKKKETGVIAAIHASISVSDQCAIQSK